MFLKSDTYFLKQPDRWHILFSFRLLTCSEMMCYELRPIIASFNQYAGMAWSLCLETTSSYAANNGALNNGISQGQRRSVCKSSH